MSHRRILGMDTAGPPRLNMRCIVSRITIQAFLHFITALFSGLTSGSVVCEMLLPLPGHHDGDTDSPVSPIHFSMACSGKYSLMTVCALVTA
ncbi:uncharacterized protein BT62DRAFT_1012105 [Guyanagaster necrorhizus]|uniref:Uncharacterized protein n=1 Tax=Guyanagaster necrorhizus TaxID=856835 RepID=A0A9P8AMM5_9AGAR|nr:uncharacterized protein BT62DRAFT_1012105 [Guyanagaster necrorhizus MCA 3950]KAG7441065.1 hypothetical protein BT62DRAFT_1012105 [Guyanagaster necrorhizus MCA 3950]